jgi:hypothetical protein
MSYPFRPKAVLRIDRTKAPKVARRARVILTALTDLKNIYASPPVALTVFLDQIVILETAHQACAGRAKGTAAIRDGKLKVVVASLDLIRAYIQSLADASPDQAIGLIQRAGYDVADASGYVKPILTATVLPDGSVRLAANAQELIGKRRGKHTFHWQWSADGGRTWVAADGTPVAETTISGLPHLTTCSFRVAVRNRKDQTSWSATVSVLVP